MKPTEITAENFEELVVKSDKTVLLDFWATWCGPCRMLAPTIDEIAEEREELFVGKVNVDEQNAIASAFGIMSIPTLVVIKGGKVCCSRVGLLPKQDIISMLDENA